MSRKARSEECFAIVLAVALAGCLNGGDAPPGPTGDDPGRIEGRVLEEGGLPLAGAEVRLFLQDRSARTDAAGRFQLDRVPPGPVRVIASAPPDHAAATRDVHVLPGTSHSIEFVLREIQPVRAFNETRTFNGAIACGLPQGLNCGEALPQQNQTHHFAVASGLGGLLVELDWQPGAAGTPARLQVDVRAATPSACGTKYATRESPPALRFDVPEGFPTRGGHQCVLVRAPADQPAVQQAYTLHVTLFYHSRVPDGFTAID